MRIFISAFILVSGFFLSSAMAASVEARIDVSQQKMYVYQNGRLKHKWKVSTGKRGFSTPRGSWRPTRMYKEYYSKKYYNSPMPYSIFFRGGYAIHGTGSIKRLGSRASHGCVRLHPSNARTLYSMVKRVGARNAKVRVVN